MALNTGYKQTEAGVIPKDWDARPLKGKISIAHGFPFASEHFASDGQFRLTTPGHFYEEGGFRDIGEKQKFYVGPVISDYLLRPGEMLVAMTEQAEGLLGSAALIPKVDGYLHNQRLGRVRALSADVDLAYLFYVFNSPNYRSKVRQTAAGTKVKHTSPEKLLKIDIPLPSPSEQRAIAEVLSDMDELLGALEALIEKKRAIKRAAMQQLLTGKTRLPGFSIEWEPKRLGDHLMFLRHGVNSRAELSSDERVQYLHYGDIHATSDVFLDPHLNSLPTLSTTRAKSLDRLQDGDLVLVDASEDLEGVGKSVEIKGVFGQEIVSGLHTIAVRFDKAILADGFKAYLQFCPVFRKHLRRLAAGTKVYATNRAHIASVEMLLPCTDEQIAIAAVLSDMDAEIKALEARRDKTRAIKQSMMQQLLTGRIRLVKPQSAEAEA